MIRYPQRGAALVTALLVVALAVAAVVPWLSRERVAIASTANLNDWLQARLVGRGLELWAKTVLARDGAAGSVDHLGEEWAIPVAQLAIERGRISGALVDAQGRMNLNSLMAADGYPDPLAVARFGRLLEAVGLEPRLTSAMLDWMDEDEIVSGTAGAESAHYANAEQPYRAANAEFAAVSELRLVAGFDAASVARLTPYVSVLPGATAVNVNTAPPAVLQALTGADKTSVQAFAAQRKTRPFSGPDELAQTPLFAGGRVELDGLDVSSHWFELKARIELPRAASSHFALINRTGERAKVLRRRFGP